MGDFQHKTTTSCGRREKLLIDLCKDPNSTQKGVEEPDEDPKTYNLNLRRSVPMWPTVYFINPPRYPY